MEEFIELTMWKGSAGSPGIYQRECVIRTISQAELEALMCDIFQDSRKAESVTLWKDVGILEAALEVGNAGGRETRCSQTAPRGCFQEHTGLQRQLPYSQRFRGLGCSTQNVSGTGTPRFEPHFSYAIAIWLKCPKCKLPPFQGWAQLWDQSSTVL